MFQDMRFYIIQYNHDGVRISLYEKEKKNKESYL